MPPNAAEKHVAAFEIKADGQALDDTLKKAVIEIKVRDSLRLPKSAVVRISDPRAQKMDSHPLKLGSKLEISLGAIGDSGAGKVFEGEIVTHEPEFERDGVTIVVRAYDKTHRLQREKKVRTFQQVSASDIVSRVTQEAGLQGSAESTGFVHQFFQQSDETDRELIRRLELLNDFEFAMEDGSYKFRAASTTTGEVELKYPDKLLVFRPRVSATQQVEEVEVRGWDPKKKEAVVGSASNGADPGAIGVSRSSVASLFGGKVMVVDRVVTDTSEARKFAQATLDRRAAQVVEAEGTCQGNSAIKAGRKLKLTGLGTKFSGSYHATTVTHVLRTGAGAYQTHFQISGRSERGLLDLMHPPPQRNWADKLVVGLVTNNNDPDGLGRIRVKYPALSDSQEGEWARVLTHSAGSGGRGIFMLPQVGEEVVVAFENGDARRPLIIGSLFNGKDKPTAEILPDQKGGFSVVSLDRGYMHTKEDFTIKSDQKLIIEVTNDHTIKVDGKQEQKVSGNVSHETQGSGTMKASASYTIEAGSSVTIKGASISVEASGPLKLKGATVDIEASGPATLKGAMVDVNASGIANLKGSMVNIG
jgi:phage protein D/phage baseplate assembly protein gpV